MKSLNILTIDDDLNFAKVIKVSIESWGHQVTLTHNWFSFMRKLKSGDYDAIVADVETPTGNGVDAISFLCMDTSVKEMPKAFVTGRSDVETIRKINDLGAQYIHKSPSLMKDLDSFITCAVEKLATTKV